MLRRMFTIASAVSLLLFVGAAVLWVRSYSVYEGWVTGKHECLISVYHYRGLIRFLRTDTDPRPWWQGLESHPAPRYYDDNSGEWEDVNQQWHVDWESELSYWADQSHTFIWHHAGIVVGRGIRLGPIGAPFPTVVVEMPDWLVVGCIATVSMELMRRLLRRHFRAKAQLCVACGYDIRASPEDQSRYPLNYASRIGADRGH